MRLCFARMARAARVTPVKECGYVLVPIGEDEDGPFTTAVEVMRAYVANDEELREELNAVARAAARRGREPTVEEWPPAHAVWALCGRASVHPQAVAAVPQIEVDRRSPVAAPARSGAAALLP